MKPPSCETAAREYVTRGWPVAPGPVCDGITYRCGERRVTGPLTPVHDRVREPDAVRHWWSSPRMILAPVGEAFDVLCMPVALAAAAAVRLDGDRRCPVMFTPQGARVLVAPGARPRGVRLLDSAAWLPLPPSRLVPGSAVWWVSPADTDYRVGDAEAFEEAALEAA